jgi:hypothetical protein
MKKFLTALLLVVTFSILATAQDRITKSQLTLFTNNLTAHPLLKEDDADFKTATKTNKWSDESAVILCQKTSFDFDKKGLTVGKRVGRNIVGLIFALPTFGMSIVGANARNDTKIMVEETERRRILLKDKYALELYSVLYFRLNTDGDAFDARVIKADGSIQKISVEDAVKVENLSQVPDVFRSYTDDNFSSFYRPVYFKIVVPDLQEGDILEYAYVNYNSKSYSHNPSYKEFSPVYYLCNRTLPVEKQIIEVVMQDDKYHLGYKNLQGAPEFSVVDSKEGKVYRWEDNGREKMSDIRYVNRNLEMPSLKFQVIYAKKAEDEYMFVNSQKEMKNDLSEEQFSLKSRMFWFATAVPSGNLDPDDAVKEIYGKMKKRDLVESTDDEYVKKAYYTIRSYTLFHNWNDYGFAKVFAGLLDKKKLPYEVVATSSNVLTGVNNLTFVKEIVWLIKYKNKYYSNPFEHLNAGEIPMWLAGNKAVSFVNSLKASTPSNIVLPLADTASNVVEHVMKASLDTVAAGIVIDENVTATGLVKGGMIDDILALTPFMETDHRNYDGDGLFEGMSTKDKEKAEDAFIAQKKEWKEEKPKMMKEMIQGEYNREVSGDVTFHLTNDGRSFKKQSLTFSQKFVLSDMTAHAGQDLVVSLPALVGEQSQIKKEERSRKTNADLSYPRTLKWNIRFAIPAGYTVLALDKLNKEISNATGSFSAKATIEGSDLVLLVQKSYFAKYLALPQWPSLVEVLDAAFNYSQSKIILKKTN